MMVRRTTARAYDDGSTVIVPAAAHDWLDWFRWHARLAGTGAILGPSRGVPDVGPHVVECLPAPPSLAGRSITPDALLEEQRRIPPLGGSGITPPDPGIRRRH